MVQVPVYNITGQQIETIEVDEQHFGGRVNPALLKQAVVAYHTNTHQGSATSKSRARVSGSGRKLFRQKGTGNARRGPIRTNVMRGGGAAFGKVPYRVRHKLSKKMRQRALDSAILAKMLGDDLAVVDGLKLDSPRTKTVVGLLDSLEMRHGCLLALGAPDDVVYRSARNIPRTLVRTVTDLNAYDVAIKQKMLLTREAMDALLQGGK